MGLFFLGKICKTQKMSKNEGLVIVLNNIRSAYNVGQAFRVADAVGVEKLYLCGITPYPNSGGVDNRRIGVKERADREIRKTALSGYQNVSWEYRENGLNLVTELQKSGFQIVSAEVTDQSIEYTKAEYQPPLALVLGHEINGVDKEILAVSNLIVKIPMLGKSVSLNVTNAMAVILYGILNRIKGD